MGSRTSYLKRIFSAYLTNRKSHLTFWHGIPSVNENLKVNELGEYYMPFIQKADYPGHYDENGIPMLDYRGEVGLQYNPIAIAQYGLGNYNLYIRGKDKSRFDKAERAADWLVENIRENSFGLYTWMHDFDWEYRDTLKAPWYSALSQGQGISLLSRMFTETEDEKYLKTARKAYDTFLKDVKEGGVTYTDKKGNIWFEETIVDPPTHILNGFLWALWGIYDYYLITKEAAVMELFNRAIKTLEDNLSIFDTGYWSLYEQSGTRMKMLASFFYHSLHIVQLRVMYKLTSGEVFKSFADRWEKYRDKFFNRKAAFVYKAIFKLFHY